jgi:hypothetical protein
VPWRRLRPVAILIAQPRGVVCSVCAAFTQGTQTDDTACSTGHCTTEPWSSCVLRRDVGDGGSGAVQRLCSDRGGLQRQAPWYNVPYAGQGVGQGIGE